MKRLIILLGLTLMACGVDAPSKTDITCQSGHGTCYIVHCEARDPHECTSYFPKFCPKAEEFRPYGIVTDTQRDYLLECK